jgi:transposase-like protein
MATNAYNSRWTPELRLQVEKLASQGLKMRDIGAQVGMTKNQIVGWLNRNHYDGPTMEDRIKAMHAKLDAVGGRPAPLSLADRLELEGTTH